MDLVSMYPEYLRLFTRDDYAAAFERYCGDCADFFAGLTVESVEAEVGKLMEYTDGLLLRRPGRRTRCFDLRSFFCVYLCPAAVAFGTEAARRFAEGLADAWNGKHPEFHLEAGAYEDIAKGFRTKPFGISF